MHNHSCDDVFHLPGCQRPEGEKKQCLKVIQYNQETRRYFQRHGYQNLLQFSNDVFNTGPRAFVSDCSGGKGTTIFGFFVNLISSVEHYEIMGHSIQILLHHLFNF